MAPSSTHNAHVKDTDKPSTPPFATAIQEVPITESRKPFVPRKGDHLLYPGTARANVAASEESPNGTTENDYTRKHQHQTVLQQHVDYFDPDHDGVIWPQDTYYGCKAWGWNPLLSIIVVLVIHLNLSYFTLPSWLPDPLFRIHVNRIHNDKHGSDSMSYDGEGRFRSQNFEDIFAKYDKQHKGGLTWSDVLEFWKGQMMVLDFFGSTACLLEWTATYLLIWPEDGLMRKEDIRGIFDGSIFYKKAEDQKKRQHMKAMLNGKQTPS